MHEHSNENCTTGDLYELIIGVEDCNKSDEVTVRVWIDNSMRTQELMTETELALSKRGGECRWTGNFSVPKHDAVFAYRVGLLAQPGASWSLSIRECGGQRSRTLLEDSDVFTMHKEWLLGTCETHD